MRRIAVVDAPSNLGLRPPTATSVPGCAKAPGALRDHGLLTRLGARDAGCITPPRYDPAGWQPGDGVAQAAEIVVFVRRLADRIGSILAQGDFPVVLGGDCSILLGAGLAMRRHAATLDGRVGLVYVDGHSDFRHEGNASYVGAAAGEALALATGRGQADLASIEQRRPYFRDVDVVLLGIRTHDEYRLDLQAAGIVARAVPELRSHGAARSAQWARDQLRDCAGYWVHVDVDVLDPAVMPAVDAPDVGGIAYRELEILLSNLVADPRCVGVQVTVFDPDYDPDGRYAAEVTDVLVAGLEPLVTSTALVASDTMFPVSGGPVPGFPVSAPPVSAPPLRVPAPPTVAPRPPAEAFAALEDTSPADLDPLDADEPDISDGLEARVEPDADADPEFEPVGFEPVGFEPVEPSPIGIEPVGFDPAGPDPAGFEPVGFEPVGVEPVEPEPLRPEPEIRQEPEELSVVARTRGRVYGTEERTNALAGLDLALPAGLRGAAAVPNATDGAPENARGRTKRRTSPLLSPFVPAQPAPRDSGDDSPESPVADVVPAARTPVDDEDSKPTR